MNNLPRRRPVSYRNDNARGSRLFWRLISPEFIMILVWAVGGVSYMLISAVESQLDYFNWLALQENIRHTSSDLSFIWLTIALLTFVAGARLAPKVSPTPVYTNWSDDNAIRGLFVVFWSVFAGAFLWVGTTVLQVGFDTMVSLAMVDNTIARETVLGNAFPGGRLLSNGFIATTIFSAMMLARPRQAPLLPRQKVTLIAILLFSLAYLGLIPILVSGRINFFAAIIASYIAVCIVRGRFFGVVYLPLAVLLMAIVWTAKQYFSLHNYTDESVFVQSFEGFLFYIYNDMLNAINIIGNMNESQTHGYMSIRFIFFFTLTDKMILDAISDSLLFNARFAGGGEFPLLTAPYVDFGWFGLILIFVIGFLTKWIYARSFVVREFGTVYALMFAGLCLSLHSSYITLQDPVFSMLLLFILYRYARMPLARAGKFRTGLA